MTTESDESHVYRIFAEAFAPPTDAVADFCDRLTAIFPELPEKTLRAIEAQVRGRWNLLH
jgi:hypothetical protein